MADPTPEQAAAEAQLEAAILACAAAYEGPGEILTGWVLTATLTSGDLMDENSTAYFRLSPDSGQPFHVTIGLLRYHLAHLERDMFEEDD